MKGYSEDYYRIRQEVVETWPDWKKESYNTNFAISTHAKKLPLSTPPEAEHE